jgi:serine protease AprX
LYGTTLEGKASHAFCERFGNPAMLEAANETAPGQDGVIVEFKHEPSASPFAEAFQGPAPEEFERMFRGLLTPADAVQAIRTAHVRRRRESFEVNVQSLRQAVEKRAGAFGIEAAAYAAVPRTEICWLNHTMRVRRGPRALAEIADHPIILRVDLPRRVHAELNRSSVTVGAPDYRTRHSRSGADTIIAVIDSEIALHQDLGNRIVQKRNYTNESWGHPHNHGTAVAGIIGSVNNPFTGMAPSVVIYNYKVIATNAFLNADDFGAARAIQAALEDGARIANCSWGAGAAGDGTSREARACDAAWDLGLIIVKSAGNNGPFPNTMTTPADARGVIVVGATDVGGNKVQDYSSRGSPSAKKRGPDLCAPGGSPGEPLKSALAVGGIGDCGHGTSFAAPHISGIIALLVERDEPNMTPNQVKQILQNACRKLPGSADDQGAGLIAIANL